MPATSGTQSKEHVASMSVVVDGQRARPQVRDLLSEVKVVDSLTLPDMALVRITDLKGENIDANPLKLGAKIEIKAGDMGANTTESIFKGQIAAVEPEFTPQGVVISARAYDDAHKLNRQKKSRTFQQMSASDMARKVVGEAGLAAGEIKSTSVVHEFFQQSNETDWDFLWRLALMHDYEVVVTDGKLNFRPANVSAGSAVALRWGENLQTFRPRMSGIQQVDKVEVRAWDPKAKKVVNGSASSPTTTSKPGVQRSAVAKDLGGGTTVVTDRVATSTAEANEIAKSTLQRMADAYFEADGVAIGNPKIKAGCKVKVEGVGHQVRRRVHDLLEHALLPRPPRLPDAVPDLRPQRADAHRARPPARQSRLDRVDRGRRGDQQQRPRTTWSGAREVPEPVRQGRVGVGARRHPELRQRARPADAPAARRGGRDRLRARRQPPPDRARLDLQRQGQAGRGSAPEPRRILRAC